MHHAQNAGQASPPAPQVVVGFEQAEKAAADNRELLNRLADRIEVILRPNVPCDTKPGISAAVEVLPHARAPFANRLAGLTHDLQSHGSLLRDLLDRLEV